MSNAESPRRAEERHHRGHAARTTWCRIPLNSPVEVFAPALAGPAAVIYGDDQRTAQALRAVHAADAARYATYRASLGAVCRMLRSLLTTPAPGVDEPDVRDLWNLLQAGRQFRALGASNAHGLLRWAPMPVADFAASGSNRTSCARR